MSVIVPNYEVPMGRVDTTITIANNADLIRAEAGDIDASAVRSLTLDGVLVDTGATFLSLPADLIARLGLRPLRELNIRTAAGPRRSRLMQDARLTVMGREGTFECLELPEGAPPLLGVTPLEVLGLEPDIMNQRLRVLPDGPLDTYVTVL